MRLCPRFFNSDPIRGAMSINSSFFMEGRFNLPYISLQVNVGEGPLDTTNL